MNLLIGHFDFLAVLSPRRPSSRLYHVTQPRGLVSTCPSVGRTYDARNWDTLEGVGTFVRLTRAPPPDADLLSALLGASDHLKCSMSDISSAKISRIAII